MDVEFKNAIQNLPENMIYILNTIPKEIKENAKEIKMRLGRKIAIKYKEDIYYINKILNKEEIEEIFKSICGYSVHSHIEEINARTLNKVA